MSKFITLSAITCLGVGCAAKTTAVEPAPVVEEIEVVETVEEPQAPAPEAVSMVTLAAPGVSVVTTSAPPDEAYTVVQGTSFATPRVTGAAVLLMAEYPDLTPPQVKELLLSTSRATTELSGAELQGGLLDVNSLLGTSLNTAPFWTLY